MAKKEKPCKVSVAQTSNGVAYLTIIFSKFRVEAVSKVSDNTVRVELTRHE